MLSPASAHGKCLISDLLCSAVYFISVYGLMCLGLSQVHRIEINANPWSRTHFSHLSMQHCLLFYELIYNIINI